MKKLTQTIILLFILSLPACAEQPGRNQSSGTNDTIKWQSGMDTEAFWRSYAQSKGGITWGQSSQYPEYAKVKEGDTFMVEVTQGICLMEFFHNRWRRANDVRRWDDSINEYGGCPNVFD